MLSAIHRPAYRSTLPYICLACRINLPPRQQLRYISTEPPTPSTSSTLPPLEVGVFSTDDVLGATKPKGGRTKKRRKLVNQAIVELESTESLVPRKKKKNKAEQASAESIAEGLTQSKEELSPAERDIKQPLPQNKKERQRRKNIKGTSTVPKASLKNSVIINPPSGTEQTELPRARKIRTWRKTKERKEKYIRIRHVVSPSPLRAKGNETLRRRTWHSQRRVLRPTSVVVARLERVKVRIADLQKLRSSRPHISIQQSNTSQSNPTQTTPQTSKLSPTSPGKPIGRTRRSVTARIAPANETLLKDLKTLKDALLTTSPKRSKSVHYTPKAFKTEENVKEINVKKLGFHALEIPQDRVPGLAYGLDRVLFNPGIYHLQDPRSRVYNFDPYLEKIIPAVEFDFAALKPYRISSEDRTLGDIARDNGFKYYSSTSSLTSVLQHFHYLLSEWKPVNLSMLSKGFEIEPGNEGSFTPFQKSPFSIFLRYRDGVYAIDSDKSNDSGNPLSLVGKVLEKLFTVPKSEFEQFRLNHETGKSEAGIDRAPESFHYTGVGNVLVRSQLDAYDSRLPGNGIYDIKTRAVLPIRMDSRQKLESATSYEIRSQLGDYESFEREYYDMCRATLLKYSLQVRLGRMDGIFVAYHNISRLFGFQYMSIEDMDFVLHGTRDRSHGDDELKASLTLLNEVFDQVAQRFPKQSVRLHVETRERAVPFMYIFAEPLTEEEIEGLQDIGRNKVSEAEKVLLTPHEAVLTSEVPLPGDAETQSLAVSLDSSWKSTKDIVKEEIFAEDMLNPDGTELSTLVQISKLQALSSQVFGKASELKENIDTNDAEHNMKQLSSLNFLTDRLRSGVEKLYSEATPNRTRRGGLLVETDGDAREQREQIRVLMDVVKQQVLENRKFDASIKDSVEETEEEEKTEQAAVKAETPPRDLLAMSLTIRNKRSGEVSEQKKTRGEPAAPQDWTVEYCFEEITDSDLARNLYMACKKRRSAAGMGVKSEEEVQRWYGTRFMRELDDYSKKGERWRNERDEKDREMGDVVVFAEGGSEQR